jgi:hypothetical protein
MSKDIIIILGFALIVVVGWISVDLFKTYTKTEAPVVTEETLRPVNPELDLEVLQDLKDRRGH